MISLDLTVELEAFIALASRIDNRLSESDRCPGYMYCLSLLASLSLFTKLSFEQSLTSTALDTRHLCGASTSDIPSYPNLSRRIRRRGSFLHHLILRYPWLTKLGKSGSGSNFLRHSSPAEMISGWLCSSGLTVNKAKAKSLLPHLSYDYAVELIHERMPTLPICTWKLSHEWLHQLCPEG